MILPGHTASIQMNTYFDCIPCLVRQTLSSLRATTPDLQTQETVLRSVMQDIAALDFRQPPAGMAQLIHRRIREATGAADPYAADKRRLNDLALALYPHYARRIEMAANPLEMAVRLAIAGNILDLGAKTELDESEVLASIDDSLAAPLDCCLAEFAQAIDNAQTILYLLDNAGEVVFDRFLLARIPRKKLTAVVRGAPVINDATRDDAAYVGLDEFAEVIDNGSDAPGTIVADCSPDFRRRFEQADLIISKGQGNYETLADSPRPIYFLLRVKCPILARDLQCSVGAVLLRKAGANVSPPARRGNA